MGRDMIAGALSGRVTITLHVVPSALAAASSSSIRFDDNRRFIISLSVCGTTAGGMAGSALAASAQRPRRRVAPRGSEWLFHVVVRLT